MRLPGFIGPSAVEQSYTASQERTVNLYVHMAQGRPVLYGTPGVEEISSTTTQGGRAHFWDASSAREFAVYGGTFFEIAEDGTFTDHGSVALNDNPATISSNGDGGGEIFITSGGNGYIFTLATDTLSQVSALNGIADQGDHIDGYFLALDFASSTVYFSNLLDGTTWDTGTDFFQRSASPDAWVAMKVLNGDLIWLFGSKTSEVWFNVGTFPLPFAPHPSGRGLPYGCDAPFSPSIVEGAMTWVGSTGNGRGMTLSTTGFEVRRVSTAAVEFAFTGYDQVQKAIGNSYSEAGHVFFLCHVPGGVTWCYDLVSQTWHERMTWISEESAERTLRWRHHAYAHGEHRWLDTDTGSLWRARLDLYRDVDDREIRRIRRPPTVAHENQRLFFSSVELLCDVGVGAQVGTSLLTTGVAAHFELGADGTEETGAITAVLAESGSPTYGAGLFGDAVTFGAATDNLQLTHAETNGAFDWGTGDFAIHCKFKRSATTGTSQVILDKLASFLGFTLWFISTDKIRFNVGNGASSPFVDSSSTVTDTDWHSVSIFRVSGTVSMYLDGQFENSASLPGDVDNTNTFAVGHRLLTLSFIGTIDQALFHGPGAGFYGDIAGAAADYHTGTVDADRVARFLTAGVAADFELGANGKEETGAISAIFTENGTPTYGAGLSGGAVTFDAATDSLELSDADTNSSFDFGTGDFALHVKFKRSATTGTQQIITDKFAGAGGAGFRLEFRSTDKLRFGIGDNFGLVTVQSASAVTDTNWHSVSVFRVDGTGHLYLDGVFENSDSFESLSGLDPPQNVDNTEPFFIGHATSSFIGTIDRALFQGSDANFAELALAAKEYHFGALANAIGPVVPQSVDSGVDPQVMMRYSDDGGRTWSSELWQSAGKIGECDTRVRWERLGVSRRRVFEFVMTDPVPWRLVDAYVEMGQRPRNLSRAQSVHWS